MTFQAKQLYYANYNPVRFFWSHVVEKTIAPMFRSGPGGINVKTCVPSRHIRFR